LSRGLIVGMELKYFFPTKTPEYIPWLPHGLKGKI